MRLLTAAIASVRTYFEVRALAKQQLMEKRRRARASARKSRDKKRAIALNALWAATRGEFVIADLETTGLGGDAKILEIAAILVDSSGEIQVEYSTLIKVRNVPQMITELTGITQAKVDRHGIALREAMTNFLELAGNRPVLFHNAPFDTRFLRAAAVKLQLPFDNATHCTLQMARTVWPDLKSHKLERLARLIGAKAPTHRGLDDVRATLQVLLAARERSQQELLAAA
jgi:DNA polymerase III subunit epsilon